MSEILKYVLFDGSYHHKLMPLTLTRPVSDLRVGIFKIHQKWSNFLKSDVSIRTKKYLAKKFNSFNEEAQIGISASLLPNKDLCDVIKDIKENTIVMKNGKVLLISPLPEDNSEMESKLSKYKLIQYVGEIDIIERPMDIFLQNGLETQKDLEFINKKNLNKSEYGIGNLLIGNNIFIEDGAKINGSTLNSNDGPIFIHKSSEIMEGSNIRGPFVLMEESIVKMGSKIYGPTTVGPHCKVGGELSNVVFQGFSNKAHDGFIGNSVIGHWCNFGADSNTSNLKNNYGIVKSWNYFSNEFESTQTNYCGLIIGDHSKCGINTMFNTGSVVGSFVNIFDSGFPPKFVPSYSWGGKSGFETYKFDKAIEVAKIVMNRRGVDLDDQTINIYKHFFK
ncbi:MAG: glucose-1-phosphate thymidylyltransferase [Flavobacteriales bacterium]|nr:glucose-1-phosphate thymidylyltransferase [Flavobacteriales bacterium]